MGIQSFDIQRNGDIFTNINVPDDINSIKLMYKGTTLRTISKHESKDNKLPCWINMVGVSPYHNVKIEIDAETPSKVNGEYILLKDIKMRRFLATNNIIMEI